MKELLKITAVVVLSIMANFSFTQCMLYPVPLTEKVNNSNLIIEGEVISKNSFWNDSRTKIYTNNTVRVYNLLKGSLPGNTVNILTEGGIVDNEMMVASSLLKLNVGERGVFTLELNGADFKAFSSSQGFIKKDKVTGVYNTAFASYSDMSTLYQEIENITNEKYQVIKDYKDDEQGNKQMPPSISTFSPTTANAGTYELITINGSGFGASMGDVDFPDANDGGATYMRANQTLIQSWSDNQVTVYVPTGATSGNIRVITSTNQTSTSASTLTVPYNISGLDNTYPTGANLDYTADLVSNNGSGGYTFTFNTNYYSNTNAVDRYDEVIEQWRCATGINWGSNGASTTATSCEGSDGINVVTFDNSCGLPGGVLGTCYSYYGACSSGGVGYWTVSEIDVKFDAGQTWNFTSSAPGGSEYDFYSVMLHEMGHGHQLGHVEISTDVMYWSISNGTMKRNFTANNVTAGNYVMSRNNTNELSYAGSTGGSTVANSCGTGPMIADPCGAQISFSTTSVSASESASPDGNLDCRPYKDYTVTMSISNAPTGDAIVTINPSGTVDLYDYQILGSPLTFTNGSTSDQTFTVRIINDAIVEGTESILLAYTISGSTDAVAGTSNQTCTITISDDDNTPVASGAPQTIWSEDFSGGLEADWTLVDPNTANSSRNAWRFDAVCTSQLINGNTAHIWDTDPSALPGIYCGDWNYLQDPTYFYREVNANGLKSLTVNFNWIGLGDAGNDFIDLIYSTNGGVSWNSLANYSGQSTVQAASEALPASLENTTFLLGWRFTNDVSFPYNNSPSFGVDDISVSGTPSVSIETNITVSSDEQYLGPNQSIYFYNPVDGDLMMYIENTSAHDYGCTTVEVNRAGTTSSQFQSTDKLYDVTDKTFRVIPTTNNVAGSYDVTLYYSEAEIAGWEAESGNLRANLDIAKTIGDISVVTPSNQQMATTYFSPITLGSFGSDVTANGSFSTGFSGFALGGGSILSSFELNFKGLLKEKNSYLSWEPITSKTLDYYEVEYSTDGKSFEKIGKVISNNSEKYDYKHRTSNAENYYRLKVFETNGRSDYSNVVELSNESIISVYPNPFGNEFFVSGVKGNAMVEISNMLGQSVKTEKLITGNNKISTQDLPDGTYIVLVKTENNTFVDRLIKSTK